MNQLCGRAVKKVHVSADCIVQSFDAWTVRFLRCALVSNQKKEMLENHMICGTVKDMDS